MLLSNPAWLVSPDNEALSAPQLQRSSFFCFVLFWLFTKNIIIDLDSRKMSNGMLDQLIWAPPTSSIGLLSECMFSSAYSMKVTALWCGLNNTQQCSSNTFLPMMRFLHQCSHRLDLVRRSVLQIHPPPSPLSSPSSGITHRALLLRNR